MRSLLLLAAAALVIVQSTPAQASSACSGCNLVDEGTLSYRLVNDTVYLGSTPYTVTNVDLAKQIVYVRSASGSTGWGYASEFYSRQARSERDTNWMVAGAAGAVVLVCLLGGCSSSSSGSSSRSSDSGSSASRDSYSYRRAEPSAPASSPPREDTSVGCVWGDRAYGTCH